MASRFHPTHAKHCVCSGCFHSNSRESARNKVLEEVAQRIDAGAFTAADVRAMKWIDPNGLVPAYPLEHTPIMRVTED